jgi:hypothetical protein
MGKGLIAETPRQSAKREAIGLIEDSGSLLVIGQQHPPSGTMPVPLDLRLNDGHIHIAFTDIE